MHLYKINKKIRGGYTIRDMKNPDGVKWKKIEFDDHEKENIKRLYKENKKLATEIRDQLFPLIPDDVKINAAYEIGQIAWGSEETPTPLYKFTPITDYSKSQPKTKYQNTTTTTEPGTKSNILTRVLGI
jgi:hypothetical protein